MMSEDGLDDSRGRELDAVSASCCGPCAEPVGSFCLFAWKNESMARDERG